MIKTEIKIISENRNGVVGKKSKESPTNVNYNFLVKLYSELNADQKLKFNKSLQVASNKISEVG